MFFVFVFLAVCFRFSLSGAFACVGARALALGGAFTGVADDTQATYWNPAGLAKADPGIVTMHTLNLRHKFNYDDYVGFSFSKGNWGLGLEYIQKSTQHYEQFFIPKKGKEVVSGNLQEESYWIQFGGAFAWAYGSLGVNVRFLDLERTIQLATLPIHLRENDSAVAMDFGALTEFGPMCKGGKKRVFSAGILIQDLNKPELLKHEHIVNIRPGLGFRPFKNVLFSIELYDSASQAFEKPQVRIGSEWVISTSHLIGDVALRGGVYHLNEKTHRAFTGGLGYLLPVSDKVALGFDYAFMWWDKTETLIHLLSFICKF